MIILSSIVIFMTLAGHSCVAQQQQQQDKPQLSTTTTTTKNSTEQPQQLNGQVEINQVDLLNPDQDLKWLHTLGGRKNQISVFSDQKLEELASENLQALTPTIVNGGFNGYDEAIVSSSNRHQLNEVFPNNKQLVPQYDSTHLLMLNGLPKGKRRFDDNSALASTGQSYDNRFIMPNVDLSSSISNGKGDLTKATTRLNEQMMIRAMANNNNNNRAAHGRPMGNNQNFNQQQSTRRFSQNDAQRGAQRRSSIKGNNLKQQHRNGGYQQQLDSNTLIKRRQNKNNANYRQESRKRSIKPVVDDDNNSDDNSINRIQDFGHNSKGVSDEDIFSENDTTGDNSKRRSANDDDEEDEDEEVGGNSRRSNNKNSMLKLNSRNQRIPKAASTPVSHREGYMNKKSQPTSGLNDVENSDENDDDSSSSDEELDSTNINERLTVTSPTSRYAAESQSIQGFNGGAGSGSGTGASAGADVGVGGAELKLGGRLISKRSHVGLNLNSVLSKNEEEEQLMQTAEEPNEGASVSSASQVKKNSETDLQAAAGNNHNGHHGKYYQYVEVPKKKAWKFGFKRGNEKHTIERHEKGYKNKFHSSFKWHAKEKCKKKKKCKSVGKMTWHYEHHDKKHG